LDFGVAIPIFDICVSRFSFFGVLMELSANPASENTPSFTGELNFAVSNGKEFVMEGFESFSV